jgi:hypothetical protein
MTWYDPNDIWPSHPNQSWRDALREARAAGWYLLTFTGKNWGSVRCGPDGAGSCSVLIFTTGRSTENVARDLPKRIRRCPHRGLDEAEGRIRRAGTLIDDSNHLMDAVDALLEGRARVVRARELFDSIDASLVEADQLMERALELEIRGGAQADAGAEVLGSFMEGATPTQAMSAVGDSLSEADINLQAAEAVVRVPPNLRERLAAARQRSELLKDRCSG